jgi:AAA ATPase domain
MYMGAEHRPRAGRPERPLDPDDGLLSCFAHELRQLRAAAGYPSYRDLARKALFSASVLSAAADGSSLPSLQVTLAYAGACGGDLGGWQRRWEAVAASLASQAAYTGDAAGSAVTITGGPSARTEPALAPAELPPAPACFTGRDPELAQLLALTDPRNRFRTASVVISGPIGVGKTAFALHFAQRAAGDYPDGQLHADLAVSRIRGQSPHDVTGMLLGALGIRAPADPQRRAGLYRSVLARRRILVMLDNAGCESAVRPLLAAGTHSLVVTTSRSRLAGLESVRRVTLDVLPAADSEILVAAVAGPLLAASPGVAGMLGELCGHLPLALWIAATRLAGHGTSDDVAARLLRTEGLLDWLCVGDLSVRQRLRSAYYRLESAARRAFRGFGPTTGGEVDAAQIAEHTGVSAFATEQLLERLVDSGLLQASPTGTGYRVPVLFASFARELQTQPLLTRDPQPRCPHLQRRAVCPDDGASCSARASQTCAMGAGCGGRKYCKSLVCL